jgi:hypothetical protein
MRNPQGTDQTTPIPESLYPYTLEKIGRTCNGGDDSAERCKAVCGRLPTGRRALTASRLFGAPQPHTYDSLGHAVLLRCFRWSTWLLGVDIEFWPLSRPDARQTDGAAGL